MKKTIEEHIEKSANWLDSHVQNSARRLNDYVNDKQAQDTDTTESTTGEKEEK